MGGASLGLKQAGYNVIGLDFWKHAVNTHNANGMPALMQKVSVDTDWNNMLGNYGDVDLLWASPPCQSFSQANSNGDGHDDSRNGFPAAIRAVEKLKPRVVIFENVKGLTSKKNIEKFISYIEQVGSFGYNVDYRILDASNHGVGQARKRCFMVGRLDKDPRFPISSGNIITMAEALGRNDLPKWAMEKPSTTIVGSFKPEMVAPPTWRKAGDGPRQNQPDAVEITLQEALILQSFPKDYRVCGPKTAQWLQVGNAVPPRMAKLLAEVNLQGVS
jgi:DNA (cytosine-5)-methyltransferase 1